MTQQEILALPHTTNEVNRLIKIKADNGYVITDYFEDRGMDIKEYTSTNLMYMPIKAEYADYRVITVEKDAAYQEEAEEARRREEEITPEEIIDTLNS